MTSTGLSSPPSAITYNRNSTSVELGPQSLLGPSAAIAKLWSQLRLLAPHFRIALLTGEPGSGADAVAQALHHLSPFADTRLVTVRASEVDRQLRSPASIFGGGTRVALYVPDIERLSPSGQQILVRLIRLRRHRRIALIASTSRDLKSLAAAGSFSSELISLLSSLRIALPALRERAEDIPLLMNQAFQSEAASRAVPCPQLDASFIAAATEFNWPGNLIQFYGAVTWLLQNRNLPDLAATDLQAAIAEFRPETNAEEISVRMVSIDHVVQEHVRAVLVGCNGNKLRAAEVLGISRSTLYRMLEAASGGASTPLALAG